MKNLLLILALFVGNSFAEDGMEPINHNGWIITKEDSAWSIYRITKKGKISNKNLLIWETEEYDCSNFTQAFKLFYDDAKVFTAEEIKYLGVTQFPTVTLFESDELEGFSITATLESKKDENGYFHYFQWGGISMTPGDYYEVTQVPPMTLKINSKLDFLKEDEWDLSGFYEAAEITQRLCEKSTALKKFETTKALFKPEQEGNFLSYFKDWFSDELDIKKHVEPYFMEALNKEPPIRYFNSREKLSFEEKVTFNALGEQRLFDNNFSFKYHSEPLPTGFNVIYGCVRGLTTRWDGDSEEDAVFSFDNLYLKTYISRQQTAYKISWAEVHGWELNEKYKKLNQLYDFYRGKDYRGDIPRGFIIPYEIDDRIDNYYWEDNYGTTMTPKFFGAHAQLSAPFKKKLTKTECVEGDCFSFIEKKTSQFGNPALRTCFQNQIFQEFGTKRNFKKLGELLLAYRLRDEPPLIDLTTNFVYLDDEPFTNFDWFLVPEEGYDIYKIGFMEKLDGLLQSKEEVKFPISDTSEFYLSYKRYHDEVCFFQGTRSRPRFETSRLLSAFKKSGKNFKAESENFVNPEGEDFRVYLARHYKNGSIKTASFDDSGHFAGCVRTQEELQRIANVEAKQKAIDEQNERDLARIDAYLNREKTNSYRAPTAGEIISNAFLQGLSNYFSPQAITNRKQQKQIDSLEAQVERQQRLERSQQYKRYIVE